MSKNDYLLLLSTIKERAHIEGSWGATLDKNGQPVTYKKGYQVSYEDGPVVYSNYEALRLILQGYNGIWYVDTEGAWYMDKSEHINNLEDAITLGKMKGQKSILKWSDMSYIWLN